MQLRMDTVLFDVRNDRNSSSLQLYQLAHIIHKKTHVTAGMSHCMNNPGQVIGIKRWGGIVLYTVRKPRPSDGVYWRTSFISGILSLKATPMQSVSHVSQEPVLRMTTLFPFILINSTELSWGSSNQFRLWRTSRTCVSIISINSDSLMIGYLAACITFHIITSWISGIVTLINLQSGRTTAIISRISK